MHNASAVDEKQKAQEAQKADAPKVKALEAKDEKKVDVDVVTFNEEALAKGTIESLGVALYSMLAYFDSKKLKGLNLENVKKVFPVFRFVEPIVWDGIISGYTDDTLSRLYGQGDVQVGDSHKIERELAGYAVKNGNYHVIFPKQSLTMSLPTHAYSQSLHDSFVRWLFEKMALQNFSSELRDYLLRSFHITGWYGLSTFMKSVMPGISAASVEHPEILQEYRLDESNEKDARTIQNLKEVFSHPDIVKIEQNGSDYLFHLTFPLYDPTQDPATSSHLNSIGFYYLSVSVQPREKQVNRFDLKPVNAQVVIRRDINPQARELLQGSGFLPKNKSALKQESLEWPYPFTSGSELRTGAQLEAVYAGLIAHNSNTEADENENEYLLWFAIFTPASDRNEALFIAKAKRMYANSPLIQHILRYKEKKKAIKPIKLISRAFYATIQEGRSAADESIRSDLEVLVQCGVVDHLARVFEDNCYMQLEQAQLYRALNLVFHFDPPLLATDGISLTSLRTFQEATKVYRTGAWIFPLLMRGLLNTQDPTAFIQRLFETNLNMCVAFLVSEMKSKKLSPGEQLHLLSAINSFLAQHTEMKKKPIDTRLDNTVITFGDLFLELRNRVLGDDGKDNRHDSELIQWQTSFCTAIDDLYKNFESKEDDIKAATHTAKTKVQAGIADRDAVQNILDIHRLDMASVSSDVCVIRLDPPDSDKKTSDNRTSTLSKTTLSSGSTAHSASSQRAGSVGGGQRMEINKKTKTCDLYVTVPPSGGVDMDTLVTAMVAEGVALAKAGQSGNSRKEVNIYDIPKEYRNQVRSLLLKADCVPVIRSTSNSHTQRLGHSSEGPRVGARSLTSD